jgi:hypothetical protein
MASKVSTLEADAAATRDRIAATVDDLQHRLSPRTLVNNAVEDIGAQGADIMASVQKAARGNPIGLVAAGLAIGVIALGRSRIKHAKLDDEQFAAYPDYDDGYGANSVDDRWAGDHPQAFGRPSRLQQHTVSRPLIALIIAAGVGALLGGLLPLTRLERDMTRNGGLRR